MSSPKDYDVGYGKPPQHTRFVKGQSGNPRGRPKKATLPPEATVIEQVLQETSVRAVIDGQEQTITGFEAIVRAQIKEALSGNVKAAASLLKQELQLMQRHVKSQQDLVEAADEPGGFVLLPTIAPLDEWEALAVPSQQELMRLTREGL